MTVLITYQVDKGLYNDLNTPHNIALTTTEYTYKNNILAHLQIGKNLGIGLNNRLSYELKRDIVLQNEQFFTMKIYNRGRPKQTTRSTFEEKLKRFDMGQTIVEQEIVEQYIYTDKAGNSDWVHIAIIINDDDMTAVIEFKDAVQLNNFVAPIWLVPL